MTLDYEYLMSEALKYASTHSTDESTQLGAILVPVDGVIISAANCLPRGIKRTPERLLRPTKYKYFEHAERNAIFEAARLGVSTDGATLICNWFACSDCARAIIQSGIRRVVGLQKCFDIARPTWMVDVKIGLDMLAEAGIETQLIDKHFGIDLLFDEKLVSF